MAVTDKVKGYSQGKLVATRGGALCIATCDTIVGWTILNDETENLAVEAAQQVVGSSSVEFDKVAGDGAIAGVYRAIDKIDLSSLYFEGGYLGWCLYLSAITDVTNTFIRLGAGATAYCEWVYPVTNLEAAKWNCCRVDICEPTAGVGSGFDATDIKYCAVGVTFSANDKTLTDIFLDHIHASRGVVNIPTYIAAKVPA